MKKIYLILSFVLALLAGASAQKWEVPADKNGRVSPVLFTAETAKKGEVVFQRNCQSCHGNPTKANFAALTPPPGDPATDKFQKQTDGALFYKITTGRSPMPQFKDVITEEERWAVIAYFRSFNAHYVQPAIDAGKEVATVPKANLSVVYLAETRTVKVTATDLSKKPIKGAEIVLFVKRYFGNLPIGEAATTNDEGVATFIFPKDIPGDKAGNLELIVKLNSEKAGDSQAKLKLAIGVPTDKPSLTEKRAMWNDVGNAPLWLLLAYTLMVLVVWSFLLYILYQLYLLKKSKTKDQ
jgi:mono/diheme cytochrome c family protein